MKKPEISEEDLAKIERCKNRIDGVYNTTKTGRAMSLDFHAKPEHAGREIIPEGLWDIARLEMAAAARQKKNASKVNNTYKNMKSNVNRLRIRRNIHRDEKNEALGRL